MFQLLVKTYNKWLSSPPIAQVSTKHIEFFSVPRSKKEYKIVMGAYIPTTLATKNRISDEYEKVAIPKEGNQCKHGEDCYLLGTHVCEPNKLLLSDSLASHSCASSNSIQQGLVILYKRMKAELKRLSDEDYDSMRLVGYQDCIFDFMLGCEELFNVDVKYPQLPISEQGVPVSDTTTDHSSNADD
jgi:hypothetical protein